MRKQKTKYYKRIFISNNEYFSSGNKLQNNEKIKSIKGIFSSGGDISVSICRKFNSAGLELLDEVMPLAAYGKFIEGEFPDMKIVSKGGMVGKEDGMELCVDYLFKNINCD
ncbi:hypothetical protein CFSAN002367_11094 [Clostridium botulinum CFSAN002367]|nr:hypothetical protein CFSAN002367_11094 [Clostridium botulinum CFSAN002367]